MPCAVQFPHLAEPVLQVFLRGLDASPVLSGQPQPPTGWHAVCDGVQHHLQAAFFPRKRENRVEAVIAQVRNLFEAGWKASGYEPAVVAEVLAENHPVPLLRMGIHDHFGESGGWEELLVKHGLTNGGVMRAVKKILRKS